MEIDNYRAAKLWEDTNTTLISEFKKATEALEKHQLNCKHWITDKGVDPATGKIEEWCQFCQKPL